MSAKFYGLRESRWYFLMKKDLKCNKKFRKSKNSGKYEWFPRNLCPTRVKRLRRAAGIIFVVSEEISLWIYGSRKYGNDQMLKRDHSGSLNESQSITFQPNP